MSRLWWALSNKAQWRVVEILAAFAFGISGVVRSLNSREAVQPFADGVVTRGTVLYVDAYHGRSGSSYNATVAFVDGRGVRHTFDAPSSDQPASAGDPADVSYVPADPWLAHDLAARPLWHVGILSGSALALGAVWVVALIARRGRGGTSADDADRDRGVPFRVKGLHDA